MYSPEGLGKVLKPLTFLHPEWVAQQIQHLTETLTRFRAKPSSLIGCFGGAVVVQALVVAFYLAVVYALHIPVTASDLAVIVPLSIVVQMLPVSLNGFGVREHLSLSSRASTAGRIGHLLARRRRHHDAALAQRRCGHITCKR
jgi:hypothetical protein